MAVVLIVTVTAAHGQGLPLAPPEDIGLSPAALARIAPEMQVYVDSGRAAGLVMVVARHGKVGYMEALGYMDVENEIPMRTDAVFRLASIRKPLLTAGAMKLVDAGKLRLDDPVAQYIPAFAHTRVFAGGTSEHPKLRPPERTMTIEHLLTNTAGLAGRYSDHPVDSLYRRAALRTADHTLAEFSDGIAGIPLQFSPGDAWSYSPAMEVVSRIVEIASGRNIDEYFREDVFTPLKMHATSFYAVPEMEGRIPVSYSRGTDGELRPNAQFLDPEYLTTSRLMSYRVLSTPADYLRFAQMLLNGGELDGERVLSRASVAAMMSNRISPSLTPIVTHVWDHAGYGFGLGGAVLVDSTMSYYPASPGTYRWAGSTDTFFWIDPKLDLIALLWSQTRGIGYSAEHHFQRLVHAAVMP